MNKLTNWQQMYEPCTYSTRLLNKLIQLNSNVIKPVDIVEIKKSIYYAKKYHGSQMRQSGEPYYSHPIEVAYMVAEYTEQHMPKYFRTGMIVTAILHDTIEDTDLTENMIAYIFGDQVASQVEALTRIKPDRKISSAEIVERLFKEKNYEALIIKLFDRLHNTQTIFAKSPEKIKKIVDETISSFLTLSIYFKVADIAQVLFEIKNKLTQQRVDDNYTGLKKLDRE